jgi:hypothetical protein
MAAIEKVKFPHNEGSLNLYTVGGNWYSITAAPT